MSSSSFETESLFEGFDRKIHKVECFGMTFDSDEARRTYFLEKLQAGLEDLYTTLGGIPFSSEDDAVIHLQSVQGWPMGDETQLRELARRMRHGDTGKDLLQRWKDEVGFPHGEIKDILALSDPPYYTACPNPFIGDFIAHYGKPYDPVGDDYRREPFAADVSEGKNDPIYNAHSYHTKVPHKAIMRYILHYTQPGDVVLDGFCGTGMTGVAAQLCGDRATVESLGYKVDDDGTVFQAETDEQGKTVWTSFSKLGTRRALLNDLSPAATFIAYNYNTPIDAEAFEREATHLLREIEEECGWMYATLVPRGLGTESEDSSSQDEAVQLAEQIHAMKSVEGIHSFVKQLKTRGSIIGNINYTVWSDVFVCPECAHEVVFWYGAVNKETGVVRDEFPCLHCGAILTKRRMDRAWVSRFDKAIGETVRQSKQVPVLINYSFGKKRYDKEPDVLDLILAEKIDSLDMTYWYPTNVIPIGDKTAEPLRLGVTHVHHFFTKRNAIVLSKIFSLVKFSAFRNYYLGGAKDCLSYATKMIKINVPRLMNGGGQFMGSVTGTLYIPSLNAEQSILSSFANKVRKIKRNYVTYQNTKCDISMTLQSSTSSFEIPNSVDYIFIDPPFGGNLMYSELNFLWESWIKIFTNNKTEAIESETQSKKLLHYQRLMTRCFQEYFRVLKLGRWMTVEFHNSQNRIWNAIQEALQAAGFVVADVRTLDKKQGTFNQITQAGAVKQDIIISCYKPNGGLEQRFKLTAGTEEGAWDFVRTHLKQLPAFVSKEGQAEVIAERLGYLLYDRMVAFHVQHGVTVPMTAAEFYQGLVQRFAERADMYFLPDQVAEYDRKRMTVKEVLQLQLFVTDESSAIQWLKQQLTRKPQTFKELHPQFMKEIGGWQKHEKPLELLELLGQNFLNYDEKGSIPAQLVSWMKQSEKLRNIIQTEVSARQSMEDNGKLDTHNLELIAAARDRWYIPHPNQAGDLEKLRERTLLREFDEYQASSQRRLKVFRLEAVRVGFKKAWQERDYQTIITVASKIPETILQEDPKLLMWYDQALTRSGEGL